jgi:hypothetical protein
MKRSIITVITAVLAVLAFAAPALASTPRVYHAGSCRAQGDFAVCVASGTATRPAKIVLHVSASPGQHVDGAWDSVCSRGFGAGSRSGSFSGHAPLTRIIRRSYVYPDSCDVSADAQLGTGGRLHIWITYVRW